ncbi:MAG: hypothetical protein A3H32_04235 [Betaproteobacteria bacterium RIFCSPLOWO2_02_FULL_63_19]|nr:MAG: hypothetical protein A3H32_04235 [Betaproteobacteria bacterium RIFCSPLOWO2_02_FULL_63_19]
MKIFLLVLSLGLLAGCAGDIAVRIAAPEQQSSASLARVTVNDLRKPGVAASKREAAFGTPMGNITFVPPETELVARRLEAELTRQLREAGVASPRSFVCDLVEFGVNTDTTPFYWDVVGRVRLVLKDGDRQYPLLGTATRRTFIWPGEDIIAAVVGESLAQVDAGLEQIARAVAAGSR